MKQHKGIILAGGTGSRLFPSTLVVSKQLMPVYDKPMIYYPLAVLMQSGIREILIITTPDDQAIFKKLLGDGSDWGLTLSYASQPKPEGLAQALIIAEDFLDGHPSALILGDNLFVGDDVHRAIGRAMQRESGATIFGQHVVNPSRYGVIAFDDTGRPVDIEEKPENPRSNYAVTGLYFYDADAPEMARKITKSKRGELEITALNAMYLERGDLSVERLGDGTTWLDTGTHASLLQASEFVHVIEKRSGRRICCPEEIAWRKGWITDTGLSDLAARLKNSGYGSYLGSLLD